MAPLELNPRSLKLKPGPLITKPRSLHLVLLGYIWLCNGNLSVQDFVEDWKLL